VSNFTRPNIPCRPPYLIRIARLGCQLRDGLPLRVQILGDVVVDELGEVLLTLDREAGAAAARGIVAPIEADAVDVALQVRTRQFGLRRVRPGSIATVRR
jgi:hypothetical protein